MSNYKISIRPLRGATAKPISLCTNSFGIFQSTPPCAGRLQPVLVHRQFGIFQSRPPARGDYNTAFKRFFTAFQSAPPARGPTQSTLLYSNVSDHFNPRPPRGATQSW